MCKYKSGIALINLSTNGITTKSSKWKKGDGIYLTKEAKLITVDKCIYCGKSR